MSATWAQIYPDDGAITGGPVRVDDVPVRDAADRARSTASAVYGVAGQFAHMGSVDPHQFDGDAAQALLGVIDEVDKSLADVGPVFHRLSDVLGWHARELEKLRRDARDALACAQTAWKDRQRYLAEEDQAAALVSTYTTELAGVDKQLADWRQQMESKAPDDAGRIILKPDIDAGEATARQLRHKRDTASAQYDTARSNRQSAENDLEYWRNGADNHRSWHALRNAEEELNRKTASRLDNIQLRDFKDPRFFTAMWDSIADFFSSMGDDFRAMIDAIKEGEFLEALQRFNAFLARLLVVLVIIVVTVVVVIILVKLAFILVPLAIAGIATAGTQAHALLVTLLASPWADFVIHHLVDQLVHFLGEVMIDRTDDRSTVGDSGLLEAAGARSIDGDVANRTVNFVTGDAVQSSNSTRMSDRAAPLDVDMSAESVPVLAPLAMPVASRADQFVDRQRQTVDAGPPSQVSLSTPRFCVVVGVGAT